MTTKRQADIEALKYGFWGWVKLWNDRKERKERTKRSKLWSKVYKLSV